MNASIPQSQIFLQAYLSVSMIGWLIAPIRSIRRLSV